MDILYIDHITSYLVRNVRTIFHIDSFSESDWCEGREYGEDADNEKKIKTARVVFTMACLDFVLDKINPLRLMYLVMEG